MGCCCWHPIYLSPIWKRIKEAWHPAQILTLPSPLSFFDFFARSNPMPGRAERPVTGRWPGLGCEFYLSMLITVPTPRQTRRFFQVLLIAVNILYCLLPTQRAAAQPFLLWGGVCLEASLLPIKHRIRIRSTLAHGGRTGHGVA